MNQSQRKPLWRSLVDNLAVLIELLIEGIKLAVLIPSAIGVYGSILGSILGALFIGAMMVWGYAIFWKVTIPATILYAVLIWRIRKQEALPHEEE